MSGTRTSNLPETTIGFSDSIHEPAVYEDQIKARLQTITSFVEGLNTSTVDLLLAEKPFARELLQELVVKEAALRWIVRVATLSNENVRARLWADIDKALDNLDLHYWSRRARKHRVARQRCSPIQRRTGVHHVASSTRLPVRAQSPFPQKACQPSNPPCAAL